MSFLNFSQLRTTLTRVVTIDYSRCICWYSVSVYVLWSVGIPLPSPSHHNKNISNSLVKRNEDRGLINSKRIAKSDPACSSEVIDTLTLPFLSRFLLRQMGLLDYLKGLTTRTNSAEVRVLLLGLDNSGKSSILKRLSDEDILDVRPTQGFVVKTLKHGDFKLNMWDVGGK